jgi:hypothetical protein
MEVGRAMGSKHMGSYILLDWFIYEEENMETNMTHRKFWH